MIEVLIVIAIIATISAILFPVFSNARDSARRTACAGQMRQAWMAAMLYRSDHDGDGKLGTSEEMGLPLRVPWLGMTPPHATELLNRVPQNVLKVSSLRCSSWPSKLNNSAYSYTWMYQDKLMHTNQNRWDRYAQEFGEQAIFIVDVNHNSGDIPMMSPYLSKLGFGINLGGSLLRHQKPGDMDILRWWTTPCTGNCPLN